MCSRAVIIDILRIKEISNLKGKVIKNRRKGATYVWILCNIHLGVSVIYRAAQCRILEARRSRRKFVPLRLLSTKFMLIIKLIFVRNMIFLIFCTFIK